jgi:hypothetical protein
VAVPWIGEADGIQRPGSRSHTPQPFRPRRRATDAVGDLLDVCFPNMEQAQDGESTLIIVDASDRPCSHHAGPSRT